MAAFILAQPGAFHSWERRPCQDSISTLRKGDVECVALCDGAGSLPGAEAAAQACSARVCHWLTDAFPLLRRKPEAWIRAQLLRVIDCLLSDLTEGNLPARNDYGCTLLAVCRSCRTGETLAVQLGDGLIAAWKHGQGFHQLTPSEQGEVQRSTWLINSSPAALQQHLHVTRLRAGKAADAYCLLSDGGEGPLYKPEGDHAVLHPVLESLMQEFLLRPGTFREGMPDFIRSRVRPTDDLAIGFLGDLPAEMLPFPRSRRVRRKTSAYLSARRAGLSRAKAARQAGWPKRNIDKRLERLRQARIEKV